MAGPGESRHVDRRLGARVRQLRRQRDMTQGQLALEANLSPGFIALVESGVRQPSTVALIALAKALDREPLELFVLDPSDPRVVLLDAIRAQDWDGADRALVALGRPPR